MYPVLVIYFDISTNYKPLLIFWKTKKTSQWPVFFGMVLVIIASHSRTNGTLTSGVWHIDKDAI